MKKIVFFLLFATVVSSVGADGITLPEGFPASKETIRRTLLLNSIVPGSAQKALGLKAGIYYAGLPATVIGAGLTAASFLLMSDNLVPAIERTEDGTTLMSYEGEESAASQWLFYGGTVVSLYGALLSAHSQYSAYRVIADRTDGILTDRRDGFDRAADVLFAPFRPANIFSPSVLPVLGLTVISAFSQSEIKAIRNYFELDSVEFSGITLKPLSALLLRVATALLLVIPNASWEEISFRGVTLEASGARYSSVIFGLSHLGNIFVPGVTIEETLLQSLYATAFGFYAAEIVIRDDYSLERAVAFHFWNNMLAFVLEYLIDPENGVGLTVGYRIVR